MWTVHAVVYVAAFALVLFEAATIRRRWDDWLGVVREIRSWMWPLAVATVLAVVATAGLLWQVPGMSWGWARAVGISTNALLTPADVDHVSANRDGAPGVALSWGGYVFGRVYLAAWNRRVSQPSTPSRTEAACRAAAAMHSVYNLLIVGVLLAFVVVKFGR